MTATCDYCGSPFDAEAAECSNPTYPTHEAALEESLATERRARIADAYEDVPPHAWSAFERGE